MPRATSRTLRGVLVPALLTLVPGACVAHSWPRVAATGAATLTSTLVGRVVRVWTGDGAVDLRVDEVRTPYAFGSITGGHGLVAVSVDDVSSTSDSAPGRRARIVSGIPRTSRRSSATRRSWLGAHSSSTPAAAW